MWCIYSLHETVSNFIITDTFVYVTELVSICNNIKQGYLHKVCSIKTFYTSRLAYMSMLLFYKFNQKTSIRKYKLSVNHLLVYFPTYLMFKNMLLDFSMCYLTYEEPLITMIASVTDGIFLIKTTKNNDETQVNHIRTTRGDCN